MRRRVQLARLGRWTLTRVEFVGVSGQVCSTRFELTGPETLTFFKLSEAETALQKRAAADTARV